RPAAPRALPASPPRRASDLRGILLRYGKIVKVAEPGLGFKIPFMESVEKISTRNQAVVYQGLQAYTRDQQPAQMTVSVSFHIKPSEAGAVYTTYNTIEALKDRLIVRQLPTQLENKFGRYKRGGGGGGGG
ncbi:SPFH domain-containing protein, partial [Escherichia coli]|uniref:SPFH domain-containing protein n=1 Tax=Escherichia coli TaxID=562 RepID=UPI002118865B